VCEIAFDRPDCGKLVTSEMVKMLHQASTHLPDVVCAALHAVPVAATS